jgi:polysaccharide export outer membrane protein
MDRNVFALRRVAFLFVLALTGTTGCQTVRTPEEKIANSGIAREFTKTTMPDYVIEPPDLVVIEVLDALPGRPITGERLVRPDGKVSLGFYGDVYLAGLTIPEAKEKVILHLRKYINDDILGLYVEGGDEDPEHKGPQEIDPRESDRVYVDVSAYNSKYYYIQGDVAVPGRLPVTGNETVLDAINFAGGLIPTAAPNNIRLVRPAPPGACCEQTLPVNLAAIISGGDPTTNYQLLPGDRIVVYRDPIVRATVFLDRLAAPFQTVLQTVLQYSFTARSVEFLRAGSTGFGGGASSSTAARAAATVLPSNPGAR